MTRFQREMSDSTRARQCTAPGSLDNTIRREIRRRAAIEPVIGHMKDDGHLGRNFLAGATGDAINVVLAAGRNLRLLRAWLIRLLAFLFSLIATTGPTATPRSAPLPAR